MENIVQIQYIISAFIGFVSAVIVAIIAGIFQLRIAKKNREIQEKPIFYADGKISKRIC
jgi:hypothetical protein